MIPDDRALSRSFGGAAEAYDTHRPSYPAPVVDWVVSKAQGRRAVEIGAGTGKATAGFVAAGFDVTAVEPDPRMVEVGRHRVPSANWVTCGAGEWDRAGAPFDLMYGAQTWHWIPEGLDSYLVGSVREGGAVAWIWNHPDADRGSRVFEDLYARHVPEDLAARRRRRQRRDDDYWGGRLAMVGPVETFAWKWSAVMGSRGYVALAGTYSDHLALPPAVREQLHEGIAARIESLGGAYEIEYVTVAHLAIRA